MRVDRTRGPFAGLAADLLIIERLAGARIDHGIEPGLTCVAATVRLQDFLGHGGAIQAALAELRIARGGSARLVVRGGKGEGRRTLLATFAHKAGRTLAMIDGAALIREDRVVPWPSCSSAPTCGAGCRAWTVSSWLPRMTIPSAMRSARCCATTPGRLPCGSRAW